MRWNNLFDDLEGQLEHELGAEEVDLRGEEERLRLGRLSVRDRLQSLHEAAGSLDYSLRVRLLDGSPVRVHPLGFGRDWMSVELLEETPRRTQAIVPLSAIAGIVLDREQIAASLTARPGDGSRGLSARLGLAFVLRDLCRRRSPLDLTLLDGALHGTIDRVGREHCDVAVHEPGTPRRESGVAQYRILPFAQLLLIRM